MYTFHENYRAVAERMRGHIAARLRRHGAILMAITGVACPAQAGASGSRAGDSDHCAICAPDLDVPVVPLSTAYLDSLARRWADRNADQIDRIDSLLRAGFYGPPEDEASRQRAHLLARLTTVNAYRDLIRLASDPDRVYEMDEETLRPLYRRYSDINVFIGVELEHLRMGRGRICMRYRLEEGREGISWHGGKRFAWQAEEVEIEGRKRLVLKVHIPTGRDGEVDFLFSEHHTSAVEYQLVEGPVPFEWFLVHDVEGAWVRKWGIHRPTAYMFWVSAPVDAPLVGPTDAGISAMSVAGVSTGNPSEAPAPLVGLRIYIPGLKLKMPCLPDVNVEDLRRVDLAMPLLGLDYIRDDAPDWLDVNQYLGFEEWKGSGPLPEEIRRRFPDR